MPGPSPFGVPDLELSSTCSGELSDRAWQGDGQEWLARTLERLEVVRSEAGSARNVDVFRSECECCTLIGEELLFVHGDEGYRLVDAEEAWDDECESRASVLGTDLDFPVLLGGALREDGMCPESALKAIPDLLTLCNAATESFGYCPMPLQEARWSCLTWRTSDETVTRCGEGEEDTLVLVMDLEGEGDFERAKYNEPFEGIWGIPLVGEVREATELEFEGTLAVTWNTSQRRAEKVEVEFRGRISTSQSVHTSSTTWNDHFNQWAVESVWEAELVLALTATED